MLRDDPLLTVAAQGDGSFISSTQVPGKTNLALAPARLNKAIVLTHDCMLDKPNVEFWQVCPLMPLSILPKPQQGDVRKNRIFRYLHLPPFGDAIPESFVDFAVVTTVAPAIVRSAKRLVSLSDYGRQSFYTQYIRWITRWQLNELACPVCGAEYNAALALPVRTE